MRVSNEEKERSRERILAAAARLFRERGIEGASVGDIMREAGMTHGGFYRHFADKDALVAASVEKAFRTFSEPLLAVPDAEAERAVGAFRAAYLSERHRGARGEGCPAAALAPEIARGGDEVRAAFSRGIRAMAEGLARGTPGGTAEKAACLRDLSLRVGALVLARAADDRLGTEILDAARASTVASGRDS